MCKHHLTMGVLIIPNDREITQLTKIGGQLLLGSHDDRVPCHPSHLLHESGAVAMVFGPWEKRGISTWCFWSGNFLHTDGLAEGFEESEQTKGSLPKTNIAMDNFIFNRKHIFKDVDLPLPCYFSRGSPTKQKTLVAPVPPPKQDWSYQTKKKRSDVHPMSKVTKLSIVQPCSINSSLCLIRETFCFFKMLQSCGRLG